MKKIVQINTVCNGSTGKIMCDIAKEASKHNFDAYCFFGRGKPNNNVKCIKIGNKLSVYFHAIIARLGFNGRGSYFSTKKLVKQLKKINPDVIHLHNVHGYYLNLKVLFSYLKKEYTGKIIWTLHDCWTFTGHCSYFTMAKCNKWKRQCKNCKQLNYYPKEIFDTTRIEYKYKKKLFTGINNLTMVTPSKWLKELVEKSFLGDYAVEVINNGIDLNVFKPTYDEEIYEKYNIPKNKKIILGVANVWEERKGFKYFLSLSKIISEKEIILLVGLDKKQINELPHNIIGIERTNNVNDLVKIYTISSVLFNPTLEDNYPTVNLEAQACGLPVLSFNTGGCIEQVNTNNCISANCKINKIYEKLNSVDKKGLLDVQSLTNQFYQKYINEYQKTSEKKYKVLQICSAIDHGGVESVIYNIYQHINKKYDFYFISFDDKIGELEKLLPKDRVFHVPPFKKGIINYYKTINNIMKKEKFDIVHSNIGIYSFICLFIAYKNKIRVRICHSHNFIKNMGLKFKIMKYVFQKMNNFFATDYISCGTEAGIWQFGIKKYNNDEIFILNNAIEVEKFKFNKQLRNKIRVELNIDNKIVIGHVGRFSYEKNHKFILELAKKFKKENKNFCFLLVGDGNEFETIKQEIDKNDLSNYVILYGSTNKVYEIINSFDLFILPSLFEAFPVTLIEAQVNGLPCIVSEYVTKEVKKTSDVTFLSIKSGSENEWYNLIVNKYSKKRENSVFKQNLQEFDIKNIVVELENFYKKSIEVKYEK